MAGNRETPLALELAVVWLLYLAAAIVMLVTYSRLPARELYKVSGTGLSGGTGRVLVFSNWPVALVAIAVLALLWERLSSGAARTVAIAGVVLALAILWPGVVDQANLDAKAVNALAGIAVLIAIVLTALEARGGMVWSGRQPGDRVRLGVAVAALLVALPWMAADFGLYLDRVPVLGDVFQTSKLPTYIWTESEKTLPSVHHGHHHGMDGVLFVLTTLLLSRVVSAVRGRRLRIGVGLYIALMASYGTALIANDAWGEQIVKRDWTRWRIPNMIRPDITVTWGVIVLGTIAIYSASVWWTRRARRHRVALTPVVDV